MAHIKQRYFRDCNGRLWLLADPHGMRNKRIGVYHNRVITGFTSDYLLPNKVKNLKLYPIESCDLTWLERCESEDLLREIDNDNARDEIIHLSVKFRSWDHRRGYITQLENAIDYELGRSFWKSHPDFYTYLARLEE